MSIMPTPEQREMEKLLPSLTAQQTTWQGLDIPQIITQQFIKELLNYDPDTGIFTWVKSKGTAKKGSLVGSVCNQRGKCYNTIMINGKSYYAHRLAWLYVYGMFPEEDTDHINGDGLDKQNN